MKKRPVILEVKKLSKSFNKKMIFKDINFKVYEKEIFSIVGPSGKGKSTIARILLGLEKYDEGKIRFKGKELSNWLKYNKKEFRNKVQIVLQNSSSSFNPRYNIDFVLKEPFIIHKIKYNKEKIIDGLKAVGLSEDFLRRYPKEMSGGQRQRIAIARALLLKPELIIMDEVLRGLDVLLQAQIIKLIIDLKEKYGFTLVFISHNMDIVKYLSDEIYYL